MTALSELSSHRAAGHLTVAPSPAPVTEESVLAAMRAALETLQAERDEAIRLRDLYRSQAEVNGETVRNQAITIACVPFNLQKLFEERDHVLVPVTVDYLVCPHCQHETPRALLDTKLRSRVCAKCQRIVVVAAHIQPRNRRVSLTEIIEDFNGTGKPIVRECPEHGGDPDSCHCHPRKGDR